MHGPDGRGGGEIARGFGPPCLGRPRVTDALWLGAMLAATAAVLALVVLATRPPHCRDCRVTAIDVEEYELSEAPRVIAVAFRCPRCGALVARRPVGPEA